MIIKLFGVIVIGVSVFCLVCQEDETIFQGYLEKEFILKKEQQVQFKEERLTIKFINVQNDRRCTQVCFWEGNADVLIQVTDDNGKKEMLILNTTNSQGFSKTKNFEQYEIQLVGLSAAGYIFSDYNVTLSVTKKRN